MRRIHSLGPAEPVAFVFLLLAFFSVGLTRAKTQEEFHLGYKFKPGESRKYKIEFTQEMEFKGYSFYRLFDIECEEKCIETVNDTLFKMTLACNKVSASLKRNDELMDSDLGKQIDGQSFSFSINSKGDISDVEADGYIEDEEQVLRVINTVLSSSYPYLPDSSIGMGKEWSFTGSNIEETKTDMEVEYSLRYKAEKLKEEKGKHCIVLKGKGETYMQGRVKNEVGRFVIDGGGKNKVEYLFDLENKCVVKLKNEASLELTSIDASAESGVERESFTMNLSIQLKKELK